MDVDVDVDGALEREQEAFSRTHTTGPGLTVRRAFTSVRLTVQLVHVHVQVYVHDHDHDHVKEPALGVAPLGSTSSC